MGGQAVTIHSPYAHVDYDNKSRSYLHRGKHERGFDMGVGIGTGVRGQLWG